MLTRSSALAETGLLTGSLTDWWLTLALYSLSLHRVSSRPRSKCCWQRDIPSVGWSPLFSPPKHCLNPLALSSSLLWHGGLTLARLCARSLAWEGERQGGREGERATGRPAVAALVGDGSRSPRRPPFRWSENGREGRPWNRVGDMRSAPIPCHKLRLSGPVALPFRLEHI